MARHAMNNVRGLQLTALLMLVLLLVSCARMGQPDGGWYDERHLRLSAPHQKKVPHR